MQKNLNIVIAGLGTVGSATIKLIEKNRKIFLNRSGIKINILGIFAKNKSKTRSFRKNKYKWFNDPTKMLKQKNVDTVLELIGGEKGIAKEICYKALKNKKNLVTANKSLIAQEGYNLAKIAEENKVKIGFEASVAGGIPIISTLKKSFNGIKINKITGILNGTSNYILTNILDEKNEFQISLKKAQKLGYAEQQPDNDLNGLDTLHKILILSTIAFNKQINLNNINYSGIKNITKEDIFFADRLGFRIKLLGIGFLEKNKIKLIVSPFLISKKKELSNVSNNLNAIIIDANNNNKTILVGEGAGGDPTSISVVSDLINLHNNKENKYMYGVTYKKIKKINISNNFVGNNFYFIRAKIYDKPGSIAAITTILKNLRISIKSLFQEQINKKLFNVVVLTHKTKKSSINSASKKLNSCNFVKEKAIIMQVLHV
tara:strand:+ start:2305 stop:3597 length:1293 start_codon:yes stop_codon:yes gene_type:complete